MRRRDLLLRVLYWIAVLAISLAILVALIMFLESRDNSQVGGSGARAPAGVVTNP